jgi:hypothetical protein
MERASQIEDERAGSAAAEQEAAKRRATAPAAEALRKGQFTQELLTQCVTIGHGKRMRVGMAWIGDVLRLDARAKRMELRPGTEGVEAVLFEDGVETGREAVDLDGDAEELARRWLE